MIEAMLILICVHMIADFVFQPDWMAEWKGKSWEILFYHSLIYAGTFFLLLKVSIPFFMLLLVSHMIIDPLKARYKVIKYIWLDQLCHLVILFLGLIFNI